MQKLKTVQQESLLISPVRDRKVIALIVRLDYTATIAWINFKIAKAAYRAKEVNPQLQEQTQLLNARQEVIAQPVRESFSVKQENTVERKD